MMENQLTKTDTTFVLEELSISADLCPHSLQELADDIQQLATLYKDRETSMYVENDLLTICGKKRAVILDCDEVLLNWPQAFVNFHNIYHNTNVQYGPYFEAIENLFQVEHRNLDPIMRQFNVSDEFGKLDAMPGARMFVNWLVEFNKQQENNNDRISVFLITKCGTSEQTQKLREKNLLELFGDEFEYDITYLDIHESKKDKLAEIHSDYQTLCFVDDYTSNCDVGHAIGIPTYAIRTYHNEHLEEKKTWLRWRNALTCVLSTMRKEFNLD